MKYLMSLLAVLCLGGAAYAQAPAPPDRFVDVPEDHWAYQSVENLRKRGILVGYPDRNLRGKRTVTRYEAATGLNRFVDAISRAVPQRRTSGAPGPQGVQGPAGSRGARPPEADLFKELMRSLKAEVLSLRKQLSITDQKAAESRSQIKK